MGEAIEAMAIAMCQSALGGKRCPCAETGKFNCRNEYPGEQAAAAYNAMRAKLVPVGWLIDHPDYDAPIFDAEARPLTENESDEGYTMQPLYALPEIDNG
jgi:peptidoglycan/xylan/chitin deacetylase (PgdA/CDA1 family)